MSIYETGTFLVNSDGEIDIDFLYDGGWFKGELGIFSLDGMEEIEPGSTDFILEAAARANSNSSQGHVIIQDRLEGAFLSTELPFEENFNRGEYQQAKTFAMNPEDEVGFILIPNSTFESTLANPEDINQFGRVPLISIPEANLGDSSLETVQFVEINDDGIIGVTDLPFNEANKDYNDIIFQAEGLEGRLPPLENYINPDRDWRDTDLGEQLITTSSDNELAPEEEDLKGAFQVGQDGEVTIDYLFDGGFFQGELGIFSLEDLNLDDLNSAAFVEEVINRVKSNSSEGYLVLSDSQEGARFSQDLPWETDFNQGEYSGKQTFVLDSEASFGMVLVPNGSFDELLNDEESSVNLLFSMPMANTNGQSQITNVLTADEGTIISWEDTPTNSQSNNDYNDQVLAIEGAQPIGISSIEDVVNRDRNWLETEVGEEVFGYFNLDSTSES